MPRVALRRAKPDDALCLSVLAAQVFLDTYATEGIRVQLAREVTSSYAESSFTKAIMDDGCRIEVAEVKGNMVGFAQVTLDANHALAPAGKQAELLRLYVQAPFAGAGVGTQLLAAAERMASSAGRTVLWLTLWVHNSRARAFYARRGYSDCGPTRFDLEGESHENRLFAKSLVTPRAA